ncbi:hypothetical protein [Ectopseudomonas khazarica]|uniref:hypothetical protein n=1 Tax=Ectopseudomonas khazarica TaxID=2502979 RepID=UPI0037C7C660
MNVSLRGGIRLALVVVVISVVTLAGYSCYLGAFSGAGNKLPVAENILGSHRFVISDKIFLVPGRYVQSYGVASDGALNSFAIRLRVLKGRGEAEVIVSADRRSKEAIEKYWYRNVYQYFRPRLSAWEKTGKQGGGEIESSGGRSFLIKDNRVLRMLRCSVRICRVFVAYSDNLTLYIVFEKKLQLDWLDLTEQLMLEILYFEQSGRALGR